VRCFENKDIIHVNGNVDPINDIEVVETELMLADLESLKRRESVVSKKNTQEFSKEKDYLKKFINCLENGKMLNQFSFTKEEEAFIDSMHLITKKPILYVCNVDEDSITKGNTYTKSVENFAKNRNSSIVTVSAAIESEIAVIRDENEKLEYISSLGLSESGLARIIRGGYNLLNLITFFTIGPLEAHAWTTYKGAKAPAAAGVIHSDFERGFICAETVCYDDYVAYNGESGAKSAGKMRLEGKEYVVNDGDIFHFRFNV
jgi:GTP-binding protein YchF